MTSINSRTPEAAIDDQFLLRWSPRSFTSDPVSDEDVASLFEAARWAPSCFNEQPWMFVYGKTDEDHARIAALLVEGNRSWAAKAPLLGIAFASRKFARNGTPNRWSAFDTGAAAFSVALQANKLGLAAHFMGGFDEKASYESLRVNADDHEAMAAFAIGRPGEATLLPPELAEREMPSGRKSLAEVALPGFGPAL